MSILSSIRRILDLLLCRLRVEREMEEELRSHLRSRADDLERQGFPRAEAERQARIEFGGYQRYKEECREALGTRLLGELIADIRYGLRQLRRNPAFTVVAVLTLALGVSVNTTMFSAVSAILLRKPPVKDPDRLCAVSSKNQIKGYDLEPVSVLDFESWRKQNNVFDGMAAETTGPVTLTGRNGSESVEGSAVSSNYFRVTGVLPVLGRAFLPSAGHAGADHVVILSNAFWHERFGSDPDAIGKDLQVNGKPYTIVGVMPPLGASSPQLWVPLVFQAKDLAPAARGHYDLDLVLARLKPRISLKQAQAEMDSIAQRLAQAYPATNKGRGITVLILQEYNIRSENVRNGLVVLMAVVGMVLLIACANLAGMLLARGAGRAHEMAVRAAVGAGRLRLIRQMLAESLLIGVVGGGAGLLASIWGIRLLRAGFDFNAGATRLAAGFRLDVPTLLFTLAVSLLATVVFGLVPAIRASTANPRDALGETVRAGSARNFLRGVLVAGEIALAFVLLAGAGVTMREVIRELSEPNGFNPNHILVAQIALAGQAYQQPYAQAAFFQQLTEKVRNIAGVESAGVNTCLPLGCRWSKPFGIVGQPPVPDSKRPWSDYFGVGPGYFHTLQIPLIRGRDFSYFDKARAPVVAIVNQEFARRFFPRGNAIGRQLEVDGQHKQALIVGIVGNVNEFIGQVTPRPQIYECYLQIPSASMALVLRSPVGPSTLAPMLRGAVWSMAKDQPVGTIQTMQDLVADNIGGDKLLVALMAIFAGLALALAAVGIYGVVAYSVAQRTREIGIRVALGAHRKDVLGLLLRQGALLSAIGCAVGLALALPLPRLFSNLLNGGFAAQGPLVAIAVAVIVPVVSLLATYIPARRATKVDPMVALRCE
jgi:putative ABC transport system permease protein